LTDTGSIRNRRLLREARPLILVGLLLTSDIIAVGLSYYLSYILRKNAFFLSPLLHKFDLYVAAWPFLLAWIFFNWRESLYPGFWLTTGEELRRVFRSSTLAALVVIASTFVARTGSQYSRPIILGGWYISLLLIPAFRFIVRRVAKSAGIAGPRAILLGAGVTGRIFLEGLARQNPPSLEVEAIFDDDRIKIGQPLLGIKVRGPLTDAVQWGKSQEIKVAVVAMPGVARDRLIPIVETISKVFPEIILIPDLFGLSTSGTETLEIQGFLALSMRKNLLSRWNLLIKRVMDLIFILLSILFVLPLIILVSIAILIETGRPIFFGQQRLGKEGREFIAWKFRTMVKDADKVLETYLRDDPLFRQQWRSSQKVVEDPRLTNVGKLLRRLSLDELPQFWNILKGEMSLVGPRPIVEEEIPRYGESYGLYTQVSPGLTGLWQVSGRSDLSYEDRVWLDTHYVRNWSIWLDIVILVRTVWVVLVGVGAY
jgi:Undecaprenyl-phosphate galactose phosphotransferase WbaP